MGHDQRLCRPDVRRGSASPFDVHLRLGFALGSGYARLWAKGRTRGIAPLTLKRLRRGIASPHIEAAKPQAAIGVAKPQAAIEVAKPQAAIGVAKPQAAIGVAKPQAAIGVAKPQAANRGGRAAEKLQ